MKLSGLESSRIADRTRVEVTVAWEDVRRALQRLFVETNRDFTEALALDFDAFAAACATPGQPPGTIE